MAPAKSGLDVTVVTPDGVLFEGRADSVTFPGERGMFEVLIYHKPLISRLVRGEICIDRRPIPIERGIAKVRLNMVTAIVETTRG